jgi:hypothetical protein
MVELVVKVRILGRPVRHNDTPWFILFGGGGEGVVCQERLRTADEISRRIMEGAAFARKNQKKTERMRSQRRRFEHEVDNVRTPCQYAKLNMTTTLRNRGDYDLC